jgi:hypothetical protein
MCQDLQDIFSRSDKCMWRLAGTLAEVTRIAITEGTLGNPAGAGDGNRTRVLSLGIRIGHPPDQAL